MNIDKLDSDVRKCLAASCSYITEYISSLVSNRPMIVSPLRVGIDGKYVYADQMMVLTCSKGCPNRVMLTICLTSSNASCHFFFYDTGENIDFPSKEKLFSVVKSKLISKLQYNNNYLCKPRLQR